MSTTGGASSSRVRNWRAQYLLDRIALPTALPDVKAKGYFRHEEVVAGRSEEAVVAELVSRGAIPISITEARQPHPLLSGVGNEYKTQFLRALLYSVEGGISPGRALEQLIEIESGPQRSRLNSGLTLLRQGRPFVEAFEATGIYDTGTLALIRAGEDTGKLPEALRSALAHLEKSTLTVKLILGAVAWTAFDLIMAVSTVIGTRAWLIPYLRKNGVNPQTSTPELQRLFDRSLDWATWSNDALLAITAAALLAIALGVSIYFGRDDRLRDWLDQRLMRLPILRDLLLHSSLSATASVMASLLKGNVTFLDASRITSGSTKLAKVQHYWRDAMRGVESGESVSRVVAAPPMSHPEQMILQAHQNVEQLANSYEVIAKQRDDKAQTAAKKFAMAMFILSLLYSGASVLMALFAAWLQAKGAFGTMGG